MPRTYGAASRSSCASVAQCSGWSPSWIPAASSSISCGFHTWAFGFGAVSLPLRELFDCDRLAEITLSVKGELIDAWYSGKHRDFGANIQAVIHPDGLPIWTSEALPGHLHDTSCARELGITAALNWSAAELDLPALADSGYESAGHGIKTPIKQPAKGSRLASDNRAYNRLLRACAGRANAASRSWSDAGQHFTIPPPAHKDRRYRRRRPAPDPRRI